MFDKRLIKNFDFLILLVVLLLVAIGIFGIGAAKRLPTEGGNSIADVIKSFNLRHVKLQFIWLISGLVLLTVVISIDYNTIGDYSSYFICYYSIADCSRGSRCSSGRLKVDSHRAYFSPRVCKVSGHINWCKNFVKIESEEKKFKDLYRL